MDGVKTKGVETLLGNPKRAVIAMAAPMIIGMIAQSANNLIDAVWVSGLGPNALAAVGFVFPLFFILIGISNGIGIGASSAVARHIGRDDKASVDKTAMQGIVIATLLSLAAMIFLLIFQKDILLALGAGDTISYCIDYSTPIFISAIILMLNGYLMNMLRSEGASKRSMHSQIIMAVTNIILDPIFIYHDVAKEVFNVDLGFSMGLGLGMAGAAWATILAVVVSLSIMLYWYFVRKDTYVKFKASNVPLDTKIDFDILRVGIPASLEMIIISIFSMAMNVIIVAADRGTDGVAIFSSTWRIVQILMIPMMAIGGAVVPIFGAAFGAKRFDKMKVTYFYSIKLCATIMIAIVAITFIAADVIVLIFTYSDSTVGLREDMILCLRILILFLPFASWGFVSSGFFQSMGMGLKSFVCTLIRNGLQVPAGFILLSSVGTFISIVEGVTAMEIVGSLVAGFWSLMLLLSIVKKSQPPEVPAE